MIKSKLLKKSKVEEREMKGRKVGDANTVSK